MNQIKYKYVCNICGYGTNHKTSMTRHRNRKNPCGDAKDAIEIGENVCPYCFAEFTFHQNLRRHIKDRCPRSHEHDKNQQIVTAPGELNPMVVKIVEEIMKNYEFVETLKDLTLSASAGINAKTNNGTLTAGHHNTVNTNTTTNTITNNANTNNINVTIYGQPLPLRDDGSQVLLNPYNMPNLNYMKEDMAISLSTDGNHLGQAIERIYFNPAHPENHAIGPYDPKDKTCKVYAEGGFEFELINNVTIVVVRHLRQVIDAVDVRGLHPDIEARLNEIFDLVSKAVKPRPEFWDVRDTITTHTKTAAAREGVPSLGADPPTIDQVPPPANTVEYQLWIAARAERDVRARLAKMIEPTPEHPAAWSAHELFQMTVRGEMRMFERALEDLRAAAAANDLDKARRLGAPFPATGHRLVMMFEGIDDALRSRMNRPAPLAEDEKPQGDP